MWHVSPRSGVATLRTAIHLLLTYLLTYSVHLRFFVSVCKLQSDDHGFFHVQAGRGGIVHHEGDTPRADCWISQAFGDSKYVTAASFYYPHDALTVLWRCWLGDRKGIRFVKNWVVGCWHGYLSGARCRLAYGPAGVTATHCFLLQ